MCSRTIWTNMQLHGAEEYMRVEDQTEDCKETVQQRPEWGVMEDNWAKKTGLGDWQLPNVRLGMRSALTPTDWMQLWNAVAYETVVQHDILAIRRKERRRLVKELDRAENGKEASIRTVTELDANSQEIEGKRKGDPGKRLEIHANSLKANNIRDQLHEWPLDVVGSESEEEEDGNSDGALKTVTRLPRRGADPTVSRRCR